MCKINNIVASTGVDLSVTTELLEELTNHHGKWLAPVEQCLTHSYYQTQIMPRIDGVDDNEKLFLIRMLSNYTEDDLQSKYGPMDVEGALAGMLPGSYWDIRGSL